MIRVERPFTIRLGGLGAKAVERGYYAYTGSALGPGGIEARVARHLSRPKARLWHVDYLLASASPTKLVAAVCASTDRRAECIVNQALKRLFTPSIDGFGASDCRSGCGAHLLRCGGSSQRAILKLLLEAYGRLGLKAEVRRF